MSDVIDRSSSHVTHGGWHLGALVPIPAEGPSHHVRRHKYQSPPSRARITVVAGNRDDRSLTEDGMDNAVTERIEQQVRSAFPDGAIARVEVLARPIGRQES
jgi:hypothetical protein